MQQIGSRSADQTLALSILSKDKTIWSKIRFNVLLVLLTYVNLCDVAVTN